MTPPPPRALTLACGAPILHYGPASGPQLVVLQPLFEEMNRCRALVAALCRKLGARGFGCWLPDLPGTGEDGRDLADIRWTDWTDAIRASFDAVRTRTAIEPRSIAIRGGTLLDAASSRRWRLCPVDGASLLRDLRRAGLTGEEMAGYAPSRDLFSALADATPVAGAPTRTVRLAGNERRADERIEGAALWRRSEPAGDETLATALADDIAAWIGATEPSATPKAIQEDGPSDGGRRCIVSIPLADGWIAATIDGPADATLGWLFVTGGSQTRVGPNRLYERLATALADAGEAVIRFDRPGVGDSPGMDRGYPDQAESMVAAARTLRSSRPRLTSLSGFGLCDGATALALFGRAAGIGRLAMANPWVVEAKGSDLPAAAVRAHYRDRLRDPAAWARLIGGAVDLRQLLKSLVRTTASDNIALSARVANGVPDGSTVVLADADATARAFADAWSRLTDTPRIDTIRVRTQSHSFAGAEARAALADALIRRR